MGYGHDSVAHDRITQLEMRIIKLEEKQKLIVEFLYELCSFFPEKESELLKKLGF